MNILKTKGIAVPYIIALILGIAVISLIGYWFFVLGGELPKNAKKTECTAFRTQWCADEMLGREHQKYWEEFAPGCEDIGIIEPSAEECSLISIDSSDSGGSEGQQDDGSWSADLG